MDAEDIQAADEAERAASAAAAASGSGAAADAPAQGSARRKVRITYDRYMEITNLIVLRVSEAERETMRGLPRDELVQWYLEQREADIESMEELEQERELITKVLAKLVKDQYLIELRGDTEDTQPSEVEETPAGESAAAQSESTMSATPTPVLMLHPRIDVDSLADGSSLS